MGKHTTELELIQNAMNTTKSKKMFVRYQAVHLHLQGYENIAIAPIIGKCEHTVGKYINAYKSKGVAGLIPTPQKGAVSKLTSEQESILIETVSQKTPDQVGLEPNKNWNCRLLCLWVYNTFNIKYSITGMKDMLHRLGFTYTRPTYVLAKANLQKQERFKQDFELLKKA